MSWKEQESLWLAQIIMAEAINLMKQDDDDESTLLQ